MTGAYALAFGRLVLNPMCLADGDPEHLERLRYLLAGQQDA